MVDWRGVCILFVALLTAGCAGLKQFPDTATNYTVDLKAKDPAYEVTRCRAVSLRSQIFPRPT
jgi:hypothetical protein